MSRTVIALLVVSNLATGYEVYRHKTLYEAAVSDKTTDREREVYGEECVTWFTKRAKESGHENAAYKLARSWRKHGQLIFEVAADWDQTDFKSETALCLADKQSNTLTSVKMADSERWMFYE